MAPQANEIGRIPTDTTTSSAFLNRSSSESRGSAPINAARSSSARATRLSASIGGEGNPRQQLPGQRDQHDPDYGNCNAGVVTPSEPLRQHDGGEDDGDEDVERGEDGGFSEPSG